MATRHTGRSDSLRSSVLLQILLYISAAYSIFYFLSSLLLIIYKTEVLSYPQERWSADVLLLVLMAVLELLRLYWGLRGNLQESERYTGLSLLASAGVALLVLYFLLWQAYVLRAELLMGAVQLCLCALLGTAGLAALARFTR